MNTKQELLDTQLNVKEADKQESNSKLIEYKKIENSPFMGVRQKDKWFIVLGNQIVSSERFDTIEEMIEYVENRPYELIMNGTLAYMTQCEKLARDKGFSGIEEYIDDENDDENEDEDED